MSLDEIIECIKFHKEVIENKYQVDTYLSYQTASLTANFVGLSFNGKQIPSFYDVFPMYKKEKQIDDQRVNMIRDSWIIYAQKHNERYKK